MKQLFPRKVVRKAYATCLQDFNRFPVHVKEFLINKYADENGSIPNDAIQEIFDELKKMCPDKNDKEIVRRDLVELGQVDLIGQFDVTTNLKNGKYYTQIEIINEKAVVNKELIGPRKFPALLKGGLWGRAKLQYIPQGDTAHVNLRDIQPFQTSGVILEKYIHNREKFSIEEWIDFILRSIGYNPQYMSKRLKLLYITRLIPIVEASTNMMEFGAPGTGKSFLFENISNYCRMIVGGKITEAKLIYNATSRENGLVFKKDVLCFDEINKASSKFNDLIPKLQQIMASDRVERADLDAFTNVSLVFQGNIDLTNEDDVTNPIEENYLQNLPKDMYDSAFFDRIHFFIHGWEFARFSEEHLNKNLGLISNYFGEALHKLRSENKLRLIEEKIEFHELDDTGHKGSIAIRDKNALIHIISGYIKLLFPHNKLTREEWTDIVELAIELRQNVIDEIIKIDKTLNRKLGFDFREYIKPSKPIDEELFKSAMEEEKKIKEADLKSEGDDYLIDLSTIHTNEAYLITRNIPFFILIALIDKNLIQIKMNHFKIVAKDINDLKFKIKFIEEPPMRKDNQLISDYTIEQDGLLIIIKKLKELFDAVKIVKKRYNALKISEINAFRLGPTEEINNLIKQLNEEKSLHSFISDIILSKIQLNIKRDIENIKKYNSLNPDLFTNNYASILKKKDKIIKEINGKIEIWEEANIFFNKAFSEILNKLNFIIEKKRKEERNAQAKFGGAKFPLYAIDGNNLYTTFNKKKINNGANPILKIKEKFFHATPYYAYFFVSKHLEKLRKYAPPNEYIKWHIETKRKMGNSDLYADVDVPLVFYISPLLDQYKDQINHFYLGSGDKDFELLIRKAQSYNIPVTLIISEPTTVSNEIVQLVKGDVNVLY